MTRRVTVTGMGCVISLGNDWQSIRPHLEVGRTAIRYIPTGSNMSPAADFWKLD